MPISVLNESIGYWSTYEHTYACTFQQSRFLQTSITQYVYVFLKMNVKKWALKLHEHKHSLVSAHLLAGWSTFRPATNRILYV